MKRNRGSALLTALVVITLLLLLAFTAAGGGSVNLWLTGRKQRADVARNLAEAAIARAISRMQSDPTLGGTLEVQFASAPGDKGVLTFDKAAAASRGLPYSTNNLQAEAAALGWAGTSVPAQCAHLVGRGQSGGSVQTIEAVVFQPRCPYALGSSGSVKSLGGLQVFAMSDLSGLQDGEVEADKKLPGTVVSNSAESAPRYAVSLRGPHIDISGDVQASGEIDVSSQVSLGGEVRPYRAPVGLPKLELPSFNTEGKPGLVRLPDPHPVRLEVEGYAYSGTALRVDQGLNLARGVLFVNGDLHVTGGISGTGAVIVNGTVLVDGTGPGLGDGRAALLAQGDVRLFGQPGRPQAFHGMLYTEGDFTAQYADLAGVFVANRAGGSAVAIDNTRIIQLPEGTLQIPMPGSPGGGTGGNIGPLGGPPNYFELAAVVHPVLNAQGAAIAMVDLDLSRLILSPQRTVVNPLECLSWRVYSDGNPSTVLETISFQNPGAMQRYSSIPLRHTVEECQATVIAILQDPERARDYLGGLEFPPASSTAPGGTPTPGVPTPGGTTNPGTEPDLWTLDLSRFVAAKERMRVRVWRDL